jgi:hypothetical protein
MAGPRPFDDSRYPDLEGLAECFLCGHWVDPFDGKRGTFEESPAGPRLPIHLPCLEGRRMIAVSLAYHKTLADMAAHATPQAQ